MNMAKYDESKDETIAILGLQVDDNTQFEARVMRYDGGEKKLQIRRQYKNKDGEWAYNYKLGRFTAEELKAVIRLATAISPHFDIRKEELQIDEFAEV
jgi:hypothetical protein